MAPLKKREETKVVVVDDEQEIRDMLFEFLQGEGFLVTVAPTGAQGIELIMQLKPDLIMLDIILPDIDGISIYEKLRSDPNTSQIPIVFFSALGEGIPPTFARRTGDAPYTLIPKPVSTSLLIKEIDRLLRAST